MNRSLFFQAIFLVVIGLCLANTGCATLKDMLGFETNKKAPIEAPAAEDDDRVKFSDNPNVLNPSDRQYRRMTRSRMEEESELYSQAGSMWVGEGQGAYLFAQNKTRREGDVLNVRVEGAAQKQVETKVAVIKKLLKQLEEEELKQQQQNSVPMGTVAEGQGAADAKRAPASAAATPKEEKEEPLDIQNVPTKIIERLADGNYRVKGQQPFMIGKREYKVIVTGLVRPEDFSDEGMSSNKLLDPQFDVVSIRRNKQ